MCGASPGDLHDTPTTQFKENASGVYHAMVRVHTTSRHDDAHTHTQVCRGLNLFVVARPRFAVFLRDTLPTAPALFGRLPCRASASVECCVAEVTFGEVRARSVVYSGANSSSVFTVCRSAQLPYTRTRTPRDGADTHCSICAQNCFVSDSCTAPSGQDCTR